MTAEVAEPISSRNDFHNSPLHIALVPQSVSQDSDANVGAKTAQHRARAAIETTMTQEDANSRRGDDTCNNPRCGSHNAPSGGFQPSHLECRHGSPRNVTLTFRIDRFVRRLAHIDRKG